MKAVFYNINNCVSTEEFDMDSNPYHINDVINLDTTCIKINQDDYTHKVEENIDLTGTFKIVAINHHATSSGAGNNYSNWGTLKIVTDIEPTILFYKSDDGEKHNLIEQIAMEKVRELIKTSGTNNLDVEIQYVTLL